MRTPLALSALLLFLPAAFAQSSASSVCEGDVNVIRVSEIKPGMMETFLKAVDGHKAWYAAAGAPDKITAMRVIDRDPATKAQKWSETTVVTTHIEPATRAKALPPEGDSYKAFVDLYKQSSTIKTEFHTCMPKM